jgi:hypothetical protein
VHIEVFHSGVGVSRNHQGAKVNKASTKETPRHVLTPIVGLCVGRSMVFLGRIRKECCESLIISAVVNILKKAYKTTMCGTENK